MIKYFVYFCATIISVYGAGEFSVLTSPPSALFKGHDHVKESLLTEIYTASLGFTTEQDSNWQGMYIFDPFNLARAIVTIAVDGVADICLSKGHHFPLKTDEDESEIYDALVRRIEDRYPSELNLLVHVDLNKGLYAIDGVQLFKGIKDVKPEKPVNSGLNLMIEEDRQFLEELALLNAIIDKVIASSPNEGNGFIPEVFWFKVSSLHAVSDLHGENSTAVKEAKQLLQEAIERLNVAFQKYYEGRVLINVITSDASHTRRVRREANEPKADEDKFEKLNLAKAYNSDYPVIFNIMLWFGVAMIFSLLAISLFIGNMDPGRDSIIYRMTSTRMKKDN